MAKLKNLFQKAWTAVTNPGQDERVESIVTAIGLAFQTQKQAFDLDVVVEPIECTKTDVQVAAKTYYQKLLNKFWANGVPELARQKTLRFVAAKLKLDGSVKGDIDKNAATIFFGAKLGGFLADGIITDEELEVLSSTAAFVGLTVPEFVRSNVAAQGLGLLRGLFAEAISTGVLELQTWDNLLSSAKKLGLSESELRHASTPLARSFAEHVLADTKSDGVLNSQEEQYVHWLIGSFDFDDAFKVYVANELKILRERTQIASGNLPTISSPAGINLNAGEILYFCRKSTLRFTKHLKTGMKTEEHEGRVLFTDNRLLFDSASKPVKIPYKSIIAWKASGDRIQLSVNSKPELTFYFPPNSEPLLADKFTTLVRLHSQVLRRKIEGEIDRHIPRDIRQRVWQRYGGKCVECGAMEYLEFDHIVPVAKGGSNSEQNVQLLCRRCNSQKSDKI